ncbi:MAG: arginine--tRNA ligase [Candidatus Bipolaricaulis sp.]|nr:arginine--tRNA ligase [Candidatus Bipolaricaulis sp.]
MPTTPNAFLRSFLYTALAEAYRTVGSFPLPDGVELRPSDRPEFGDYSSNLAMMLARSHGVAPRALAEKLVAAVAARFAPDDVRAEVAGPGFVNLFIGARRIHEALCRILQSGDAYGCSSQGAGRKSQVEFVSSNPTGPLTVGHGRQAVLGDVLASLHAEIGYDVKREYYFNDEGRQVDLLAESLWIRYRELFGESRDIPEGGYHGEYLKELAREVRASLGEEFPAFDDRAKAVFRREAVDRISASIRKDLAALGIRFDAFFSEETLHRAGKVDAALAELRERDAAYDKDGAVWLRADHVPGGKDSVLIRSDGRPTYLMVDIAYHIDKRARGFEYVINVQGADHVVEQACMQAALAALGFEPGFLRYAVHQFVSLKEGGEVQRMSTRAGRFVTLRDLLDEVGADIVRYFMISRKPEAHLDFDLDLARSQSLDNPATYIQYAHTRICAVFRKAAGDARSVPADTDWSRVDLAPLVEREELELIKRIDEFPDVLEVAATSFAPHLVPEYALGIARAFHGYYDRHRVLSDDAAMTLARLALLRAIGLVLRRSLGILGMAAPEAM